MTRRLLIAGFILVLGCENSTYEIGSTSHVPGAAPTVLLPAADPEKPPEESLVVVRDGGAATCLENVKGEKGNWQGGVIARTTSQTYCRYQWRSSQGAGPDLKAAAAVGPFEVDLPIVSSAGLSDTYQGFETRYQERTGRVSFVGDVKAAKRSPVQVAVVDSAVHPYLSSTPDRFVHGRAVGRVAFDLACGDLPATACPVSIENHLAMPQVDARTTDFSGGGYFGTRAQLAQAIGAAVDAWKANAVSDKAKLILNLSLGWDSSLDARYPAPNTTMAVKVALQKAACEGALVLPPWEIDRLLHPRASSSPLHGRTTRSPMMKLASRWERHDLRINVANMKAAAKPVTRRPRMRLCCTR